MEEEIDDDKEENEGEKAIEKAKLFKELALEIFPINSWENWEIKTLKRLGLGRWFGVEDVDTDNDFF